ncbi:hydroxyacyl-coenzyme A dehydrogenase, mitochondrial [Halyomorpha halys]|uniref:hydroxyacyl-coenzyme A dehydrogenase, mitochondrial n=1 Tax=Halyomorpha halys TaxID=286706 RepID=UPI0006D5000B|nr:hydroxyacyl-coenzyme A dehydrogenase, mitochondrial-like [Halyomorpha halys]
MLHTARFSSAAFVGIKHVTVIGGGQMGSGIAQVIAQKGQNVSLIDVSEEALKKSKETITKSLKKVAKSRYKEKTEEADKFVENSLRQIEFTTDLLGVASQSDLVLEAIAEDPKLKREVFASIDKVAPERTIFGTNTSSIPVRDISAAVERKDRFTGVHFFNPVPVMQLVELVRTDTVSDATYNTLMEWVKSIDRKPISCKDTPGFIVNRLLFPFLSEAIKMYERGDAELKDIDLAMKLGLKHPMGPIELADWIGHDTIASSNAVWRDLHPGNPVFAPLKSQLKLVEEGKLGFKTGEGYHKYN